MKGEDPMAMYLRHHFSRFASALCLFALCAAPNRSPAAEFFWVGGNGVWDDNPANWSATLDGPGGAGVPGLLDPADIARLYNTGAADMEVTYQGDRPVSFIPIDATG